MTGEIEGYEEEETAGERGCWSMGLVLRLSCLHGGQKCFWLFTHREPGIRARKQRFCV